MIFGVICEFNPFHKGHKYLIDSIKSENNMVICAMSGNFVQRGEFAVHDKYTRAKTALENGADVVIEIPTVFSTLSAQGFAKNAVALLEATGVCDKIAFGAECDNVAELKKIADKIIEKDSEIKEELKKGISYPAARQNIIQSLILDSPNNILAIEYLTYTKLEAIAVKRIGKGHDSNDIIYSASEIRKQLNPNEISTMKNCEKAVLFKLRQMKAEDFKNIEDVSEGLENRIVDAVRTSSSLDEIYAKIKTKRYTLSRIRRIILRSFLSIDKNSPKKPLYLHILGFSEKGKELLTKMKKNADLPIISKYSDIYNLSDEIQRAYNEECRYTDIHALGYKHAKACGTEQTTKIVIL